MSSLHLIHRVASTVKRQHWTRLGSRRHPYVDEDRRVASRRVSITIDRDKTLEARRKHSTMPDQIVGVFDTSASLYRVFDGEELERILRTGEITGGTYSMRVEREHGSSWGENVSDLVSGGNRLRGKRYGEDIFLAKLDILDMPFHHLDPKVEFDVNGPAQQEASMDLSLCSWGLGCSMRVKLQDVDLFEVSPSGQMKRISVSEAKEFVTKKPVKDVALREVNRNHYQGSIFGVDVRVYEDRGKWVALTNDDRKIAFGANSFEDVVELAKMAIKASPSKPVPMPADILERKKKFERYFEQDPDEKKVRGFAGLKPRDTVVVTKGSTKLSIRARETGIVTDVYQLKGELAVTVKVLFRGKPIVLYVNHANRLKDDEVGLLDSRGAKIFVRKR